MKRILFFLLIVITVTSCGHKNKTSYDEIGSSGMTTRTENMKSNLRTYINKGILMGQQYGTLEGVGWQCDSDRSDFQEICGDLPAVNDYELCGIERGQKINSDSLSFENIRRDVMKNFHKGGLITMEWTAPDPKGNDDQLKEWTQQIARFLNSLQDAYGIKAPIVLFLYPLNDHSWYTKLSKEDYAKLYEKTADWLKDDGKVTNVLFGYSTTPSDLQKQNIQLPDADLDVINLTLMSESKPSDANTYASKLNELLPLLVRTAQENNLVPALKTGLEGLPMSNYFSQILMPAISKHRISYVLLGRNHGDPKQGHFYAPYPGCSNEKIQDFMEMYNHDGFIFLNHLNGLYLNHNERKN